ncbi:hypothetical protein C7B62_23360 [Pleurocapsa sp. CCALA 161]|uniref:hypothetical protein n=1 Tax=Pleurocapsa sp. CCALA 161 TaxID=2107688 RepID=UPI000D04919D|nr:hypothetical protein [Pleurocapsa sp. CCALA 161]PSB06258.1 hypothetical protein C7B62_23360 [Pleurocapsa sp. CCALA 161]
MFTIDIVLQEIPLPISVQRREAAAAENLYQELMTAMRSGSADLIELTCDKDEDKKVAIKGNLICAISINKKSGGMAEGRIPGFFATIADK